MSERETVEVPAWTVKLAPWLGGLVVSALTMYSRDWADGIETGLGKVVSGLSNVTVTMNNIERGLNSQISGEKDARMTADSDEKDARISADSDLRERVIRLEAAAKTKRRR